MKRKLVARSSNVATRQRIYSVPDGLEIDEVDHYEVRRSRVLYDDVVLVTLHRYRGVWFFVLMGGIAATFGWISWLIFQQEALIGKVVGASTVVPFLLIMVNRAVFGIDEINVYGRRSRARLRFLLRKSYARKLLGEITTAVQHRQTVVPQQQQEPQVNTESLPVM